MASVFSYYVASFHSSSDRDDHLTQSPRADHSFHSLRHILDSNSTVEPICMRHRYDCEPSYPQRTSPLHGTAANDADVSTKKPRRFL